MKQQKSGSKKRICKNIPSIIATLFYGVVIVISGCEAEVEKIQAFNSPENLPVLQAEDFETTFIDSFKIQSYMKAPVLKRFESKDQSFLEFPEGVLLIRYNSREEEISRITANYARNYEKDKRWEAKNNVVAVNEQGDTLKTEFLIWDESTGKIYSDKFVKIIRIDQIITGVGFEADQNMENWEIKNPKGTIYVTVNQNNSNTQQNTSTNKDKKPRNPVQLTK